MNINGNVTIHSTECCDVTYKYAVSELSRLLKKAGIGIPGNNAAKACSGFSLGIGTSAFVSPEGVRDDGFLIKVTHDSASISAICAKGILNGVYELAEMLGYIFLKPDDAGEWAPESLMELSPGTTLKNPRFPHRGNFHLPDDCFTHEERLRFHAKLKFNAISLVPKGNELTVCKELGIRCETGSHGLPHLLDRKKFDESPEMFRMFQPEDFNGRRTPDSNMCVTNPDARRIVAENFMDKIRRNERFYAIHAWADDLPAGGWCLCPSCRSYSPQDQNMLAMKLLCRAADKANSDVRIPVIAYHDTLFPGKQIAPEKRMFLLWAPRERCYGHRLDDPSCARNKVHLEAMRQWVAAFNGIDDDPHTFEYYLDQLLFTGMHPFIPDVILGDMVAYEKAGIKTHMVLQVCSWELLPDLNQLIFAKGIWDEKLDAEGFIESLAKAIAGDYAKIWIKYLEAKRRIFQKALELCDYDFQIYLDYRWLPEGNSDFGKRMAKVYLEASEALQKAADEFASGISKGWSQRLKNLAEGEVRRSEFESAELMSMHYQQAAMNCFGKAQINNDATEAKRGCKLLEENIKAADEAAEKAEAAGYPKQWHYLSARNPWTKKEAYDKLKKYSAFTEL